MARIYLSDYQRSIIRFCHEIGWSVDRIRDLDQLKRQDDSKIQARTVKFWIQRFEKTGGTETIKRSGRPRKLTESQEQKLIKAIEARPKACYSKMGLTILPEMYFARIPENVFCRKICACAETFWQVLSEFSGAIPLFRTALV